MSNGDQAQRPDTGDSNADYTPRQLRIARRVAERHGIEFETDLQAIDSLRAKGIDPFDRGALSKLDKPNTVPATTTATALPARAATAKVPAEQAKAPPPAVSAEMRAAEIFELQKNLIKRRRRNTIFLALRLLAFVVLPTALCGYYYANIATPMYETKSAFQIIKADGTQQAGMGGLLSGTQFATTPDAIAVQTYLLSKDAMIRLDQDVGFLDHFSAPDVDFVQRLEPEASIETMHKLYERVVKIGFDPTEGVVNMDVIAADPAKSVDFTTALIKYAEERVDSLSQRKRENQVSDARRQYDEALQNRREAQEKLAQLQQTTLVDPEAYIASLRSQITMLEQQLIDKQLDLQALLDNPRPNESRVAGVRADVDRLKTAIATTENKMKLPRANGQTLAELMAQLNIARADVMTRDLLLQAALERMQVAETDASTQSRYLSLANNPVTAQDPSYPRVFENTLLAFLIFSGIYLMLSITASVLREQMS